MEMEITKALMEMGWSQAHQLFALFSVVFVVYKLTVLFVQQRALIRNFDSFPGPPGHWLFGNVLEVNKPRKQNIKKKERERGGTVYCKIDMN